MSFWGMSKTGKDASGKLAEIPNWQFGQAKDWWGQQNNQLPIAGDLQQWEIDELKKRFGEGFGSPGSIRGTGQEIMPGVDDAIARRTGRTAGIRDSMGNIPGAADTSGRLNAITDEFGNTITGAYDDAETAINAGFGGMRGRAEAANKDIVGNIGDSFGAAEKNAGAMTGENRGSAAGTYGRIGKDIDTAYGDVDSLTGQAFGKAESTLSRLNPNGEFRAARVGRSYAPAAASTALRLRRAGIDPASLEGNAALQKIDAARARGMDDAYADENEKFVRASNDLTLSKYGADRSSKLGRLDASTGASERGLRTDLDLAEGWKKDLMNLTLGKGKEFRNQVGTQRDIDLGLTGGQMNATIGNQDKSFDRSKGYYNDRRGDTMAGRGMAVEDFNRNVGVTGREDDDDLLALDLKQREYDEGVKQRGRDLDVTGGAIAGVGRAGAGAWDRATRAGQMGGGYADDATQGYGATHAREAVNAGWGTKLLANAGMMAANAFLPGSGTLAGLAGSAAKKLKPSRARGWEGGG